MKKREILGKSNESKPTNNTVPRKATGVRAFLQAKNITKRSSPVFHDAPATTNDLSANVIKTARKSGILNISSKNLTTVPTKVWTINDLDDKEKSAVSVSLDNPSEEKWWEFVDLQKLIVANNCITDIPAGVGRLLSLQTLDAHDNQIVNVANEISNLEHLQKLNLSQNKIITLPLGLYKLKRLSELRLGRNCIQEVASEIGNLSCLLFLDLSYNQLVTLPDDIGYLSFLTTLNISNNNLKELPSDIGGLTGLHTLDASENCLTRLPASLSDLVHLEVLYLGKNKLKNLPDVSKCCILKELYMQNNNVTIFNSEVFAMTKIQLLDFRANKIGELVIEKDHLEFTDRFYLDNNDICVLPDDLALLPSLKSLTLDGNPLRGVRLDILQRGTGELLKYLRTKINPSERENGRKSFNIGYGDSSRQASSSNMNSAESSPREISSSSDLNLDPYKLKATRTLNISSRNVKALDDKVFEMAGNSQVNIVDLCRNQLTQLPSSIEKIGEFLSELKLDSNKLTSLPSCIGIACTRLCYISVQSNQISELPMEFSNLKNLREINIAYNKFQEIPACIFDLPKLEIFIAADNKIVTMDTTKLMELKRLAVLDVRNNNIALLPPELGKMTQLKSLMVEGNAFRVPSYQVISQGTDALMNYLRNRIVSK